jgi:acyl-CoA synthetase (AMP-forming)/AMP-acid ligase II
MFWRNAVHHAQRPALIHTPGHTPEQVTFRAWLERVDGLATGLTRLGLAKGDRICILAQNHLSYIDLYGACAKLGCLAYPINWRLTSAEVERILTRADPRMLVIDDSTLGLVAERHATHTAIPHTYIFGAAATDGFAAFDNLYDITGPAGDTAIQAHDPFAVVSTAAVDVIPRGAVLTHANLIAANVQSAAVMGLGETDCHLLCLPLFHVAALGACLATMHAGGANVLMTRFNVEVAIRLIEAHRVTFITSFPPVLSQILDTAAGAGSSLSSLRHVSGLEAPATIQRLYDTTTAHFWSGFGQTETSGFVTLQRDADHPGSAGKPGPLCSIKLVDDYDRDVPAGMPGEILVRGPMVFQGYFQQPEVTAYTFRNGWHHTGDIGRLDADGYLYYVKRKAEKELIKPGGENVYPAEVEAVIMEIDGVTGVCVFGVADMQWGEAIKAVVETTPNLRLQAAQVMDHVASRIARFKRPKWVEFTNALPTTADGEVDREAVKATWGDTH